MTPGLQSLLAALNGCSVVDLEQVRRAEMPVFPSHRPGFQYVLHRRHEPGLGESRTSASGRIEMSEHSGTHIDALGHQAERLSMYGGIEITPQIQTPTGLTQLAIDSVTPMIGKGVLLDVAAIHGEALPEDYLITAEDLEECERCEGCRVEEGDAVLVRTGYGRYWDDEQRYLRAPGVSAEASQWLANRKIRVAGCDNVAWDVPGYVDPVLRTTLPGHLILLVRGGIYIVENLFLEELSTRRAYEFVFVCLPLKMIGVTGSPVRPVALVPNGDAVRENGV